jgi:hypothetical protein
MKKRQLSIASIIIIVLLTSSPTQSGRSANGDPSDSENVLMGARDTECVDCPMNIEASGWGFEVVDNSGNVGQSNGLALDEVGFGHISYYDAENNDLKYAYEDSTGWHLETIDSEGDVGLSPSLALDVNGYAHISYYDQTNKDLKYAYQDGTGWHIDRADSIGDVGLNTSLVLDKEENPHISYYDEGATDLKYAYKGEAGWQIETVDYGDLSGGGTAIALDGEGIPHIGYSSFGHKYADYLDGVFYASRGDSGWEIELLWPAPAIGVSLVFDKNGEAHLSYVEYFDCICNPEIYYRFQSFSSWQPAQHLDHGSGPVSIALDAGGNPHLSYRDQYYELKYAYRDTYGWHFIHVDDTGSYGSLAVDAAGRAYISYFSDYGDGSGELRYASQIGKLIEYLHLPFVYRTE